MGGIRKKYQFGILSKVLIGPKQSWRPKGLLVMGSFYVKLVRNEVCLLLGKRAALSSRVFVLALRQTASHGERGRVMSLQKRFLHCVWFGFFYSPA